MPKLGVNIDHVATLRQARRERDPDPLEACRICEQAGADSIVAHLREDQRHINKDDIRRLRKSVRTRLNLEMSLDKEIVRIAADIRPDEATLVPERRAELTTEGGLNVIGHFARIKKTVEILRAKKIIVSLFVDPVKAQIKKAKEAGAEVIELHTGCYDRAPSNVARRLELKKIQDITQCAIGLGLTVNAGHGLKYHNAKAVADIPGIDTLNIGHSIISRAVFIGLAAAVKEMRSLIR